NTQLGDIFNMIASRTDPYGAVGAQGITTLGGMMQPGGALATPFKYGPEDLTLDPGYQFRLSEGQKVLESSRAAAGLLGTSGTLKSMTQYGQNFASNEYQNAYARALGTFQTNQNNTRANLGMMIQPGLTALGDYASAAQNYGNQSAANLLNFGL